jgi:O-antigen ligase
MATPEHDSALGPVPLVVLILLLAAGGGLLVTQASAGLSLGATLLVLIVLGSFLNAELGLHIILLSMLLSPEIVVGGVGGISIGKPEVKGDVLVLRLEDLILSAVAFAWLARTAIFKELGLIRRTPLNAPIFLYTASLILATLLGILFGNVRPIRGFFFTLKYIEFFVVYFITTTQIHNEKQLSRLVRTALVTCAISVALGIISIPYGERVSAPFEGKYGEPNTFGGYLVLLLAIILGTALTRQSTPARFRWLVFAGVVTIPLLFTLSRTSWLAAIPMVLTLVALSRRRFLLLAPLALVIIFSPLLLPQSVIDRYNYTFNATMDRGDVRVAGARLDTSTSARLESWMVGVQAWAKRPFLGYGVAGFGFLDAQYFRILVETGLLGLTAFLWLLACILRTAWGIYREVRGTPHEGLVLGFIAGTVAMIFHSIGANTFIIVRIMEPFWFLAGATVALRFIRTGSSSSVVPALAAPRSTGPVADRSGTPIGPLRTLRDLRP